MKNRWSPPTNMDVQFAFKYVSAAVTYENLGDLFATYDDIAQIPYNSSFWSNVSRKTGIFNSSKVLQTLDGGSASSSITA